MKRLIIALMAAVPMAALGQDTNAAPAAVEKSFQAQLALRARENPPVMKETKPNQIAAGKVTYEGIAVSAVKKPLQLVNPAAPPQYAPDDNAIRDPINGRVSGLKLFAIRF